MLRRSQGELGRILREKELRAQVARREFSQREAERDAMENRVRGIQAREAKTLQPAPEVLEQFLPSTRDTIENQLKLLMEEIKALLTSASVNFASLNIEATTEKLVQCLQQIDHYSRAIAKWFITSQAECLLRKNPQAPPGKELVHQFFIHALRELLAWQVVWSNLDQVYKGKISSQDYKGTLNLIEGRFKAIQTSWSEEKKTLTLTRDKAAIPFDNFYGGSAQDVTHVEQIFNIPLSDQLMAQSS